MESLSRNSRRKSEARRQIFQSTETLFSKGLTDKTPYMLVSTSLYINAHTAWVVPTPQAKHIVTTKRPSRQIRRYQKNRAKHRWEYTMRKPKQSGAIAEKTRYKNISSREHHNELAKQPPFIASQRFGGSFIKTPMWSSMKARKEHIQRNQPTPTETLGKNNHMTPTTSR
ncbi:hypothetical protein BDW60DRAFT_127809 [Aspergillus nidulans var. acristatus]